MISVVLPVYNGEPYIKEAVDSILAQDIEFELIVSDDGSSDGTMATIEAIADPRVRILHNLTNAGIFGNLNRCIEAARFDLIQVFSQDDVMMPGFLASQASLLARHPNAGLVYGSSASIDSKGCPLLAGGVDRTPELIEWPLYLWISSHYGSISSSISSIMIPRRTFDAVGLFDPSYPMAGDLEFYNRVAERFVVLRNAEVLHAVRTHAGMTSAQTASGMRYLAEELRLAEWYQRRWAPADWKKVRHFRTEMRWSYHIGWIRRLAMRGQILSAAIGLRDMSRIYPLQSLLWWRIARFLRPGMQPFPGVRPPPKRAVQ